MLLHLAGPDVQDIFSTLADTGEATNYATAVTALNGYFLPKANAAFARQKFHRLQQKEGETVLQFVTRLRKEGKDCNFGADFENQIRDAVLCKCRSDYVKRKLLEEREELTLARTLEIAEQCESVDHQMSHLSLREPSKEDANRVYETPERPDGKQKRKKNGIRFYRCGSSGQVLSLDQLPRFHSLYLLVLTVYSWLEVHSVVWQVLLVSIHLMLDLVAWWVPQFRFG